MLCQLTKSNADQCKFPYKRLLPNHKKDQKCKTICVKGNANFRYRFGLPINQHEYILEVTTTCKHNIKQQHKKQILLVMAHVNLGRAFKISYDY